MYTMAVKEFARNAQQMLAFNINYKSLLNIKLFLIWKVFITTKVILEKLFFFKKKINNNLH